MSEEGSVNNASIDSRPFNFGICSNFYEFYFYEIYSISKIYVNKPLVFVAYKIGATWVINEEKINTDTFREAISKYKQDENSLVKANNIRVLIDENTLNLLRLKGHDALSTIRTDNIFRFLTRENNACCCII
jgi:hypothetical protein